MHTVLKPFEKFIRLFQYVAVWFPAAGFQASGPACCDGRWMVVVDGGRSKKKFSDFAQNFFRWSSGDINVPPFRFLWRHVFKWKKIRFEVRNFGNFSSNSWWVIGLFLQVWIFSWGLTRHFFWNYELWDFLSPPPTRHHRPPNHPNIPPIPHTSRPH